MFPKRSWRGKKVPLKKMRINQLLGKWSRGLQSMKISDAVEDIMEKIIEQADWRIYVSLRKGDKAGRGKYFMGEHL